MSGPLRPGVRDLVRAALPALPGAHLVPGLRRSGSRLPERAVVLEDVGVDPDHLARYARLCGFGVRDHLPATYPHVLAFGAQLRLMTSPDFPFPAVGMVHVANRITVHRPLPTTAPLTLTVRAGDLAAHPRGRVVSLVSTASVDGELAWEDTSTYLRRGSGADDSAPRPGPDPLDLEPGPVTWRLPADLGRRYAAVSGDRNPIHLNPVLAKAFGFPTTIAHGMWTAARALAAIEQRLPQRYTYDVAFGAPILLPGSVSLAVRAGDAPGRAELAVVGRSGRTHLTGVVDELAVAPAG